jgi:hypothetical protein
MYIDGFYYPMLDGGGNASLHQFFIFWIISNVIFISIFLLRVLWWLFIERKKPAIYPYNKISFYGYCVNTDCESLIDLNNLGFLIVNGMGLLTLIFNLI